MIVVTKNGVRELLLAPNVDSALLSPPSYMPDWFYRTISRPVLFAFPPRQAQRFAVEFMSVVGRLPLGLGAAFIDLLGSSTI